MDITLYFDGATEPVNPGGTGSWGFVITGHPDGPWKGMGSIPAGPGSTNNVAEYTALEMGLKELAEYVANGLSPTSILVRGDSKLVVEQVAGRWACRAANLVPYRDRCRQLLDSFGCPWETEWVPRESNTEADALSAKAWEEATGKPFPVRVRR